MSQSPAYLALPPPISTNALYANRLSKGGPKKRGRVITAEYRTWKSNAAQYLANQWSPTFTERVEITMYVGESDVGNMDIDNTAKAVLDALVTAGVIIQDNRKRVRKAAPEWVPGFSGMVVYIRPVGAIPDARAVVGLLGRTGRDLIKMGAGE